MQKTSEYVKYTFTQQERVDLTLEHVRAYNDLKAADEQLVSLKQDFKNRMTKLQLEMSECGQKVTAGYEMRSIPCLVLKSRPGPDLLMIVRLDNGRVYKTRKMNADEKQMSMVTEGAGFTATPAEVFEFEADFYEDSGTDVAMEAAKDVPLTAAEAKEFKDIPGVTVRPHTRAKIGDGKPADGKTPKDSKKK